MLLAGLVLAGAGVHGAQSVQELLGQPIGPSPVRAFPLVDALEKLGRAQDADRLGQYLLHAYVDELAGKPHPADRTVEAALAAAKRLPSSRSLGKRWREQLQARTRVNFYPGSGNAMEMMVRNDGPVPLLLPPFQLAAGKSGEFRCTAPVGETALRLLQPGQVGRVFCEVLRSEGDPATVMAEAVRQKQLRMASDAMDDPLARQRVVAFLADPKGAEVQAFAPPAVPAAREPVPQAQPTQSGRGGSLFDRLAGAGPLAWGLLFLAALAVHWLVARALGNGPTAVLAWGAGMTVVAPALQPLGGDGWAAFGPLIIDGFLLMLPIAVALALYGAVAVVDAYRADPEGFKAVVQVKLTVIAVVLAITVLFKGLGRLLG